MRTDGLRHRESPAGVHRGPAALALLPSAEDRAFLSGSLPDGLLQIEVVDSPSAAIEAMARAVHDLVLVDLGAGGGTSLLAQLRDLDPLVPILALGGREGPAASACLDAGASEFLPRPWGESLQRSVNRTLSEARLRLHVEVSRRWLPALLPGTSPAWQRCLSDLLAAAGTDPEPVLLQGEAGTGLLAAASHLHARSPRGAGPLAVLHAAGLGPEAAAAELLGEGGRSGLLESAAGGTLVIDGVEALGDEPQAALLAAIEGRTFRRPHDQRWVRSNVRLVVISSRSSGELIRDGRIREELTRKLAAVEVRLVPLRERREDVPELARALLRSPGDGMPELSLGGEAVHLLGEYVWPGNLLELGCVLGRAAVAAGGGRIEARHLPLELRARGDSDDASLEGAVRARVLEIFQRTSGNITRTAALLGISRVALRRKLRRYGVIPLAVAAAGD